MVEGAELAGGDVGLGGIGGDGAVCGDGAGEGGVVVAGDGVAVVGVGGWGDEPVEVGEVEGGEAEGFFGAEGEGVVGAVEGDDVGAAAGGDVEAFALASGVVGEAGVLADDFAVCVEDVSGGGALGVSAAEFGAVVAVGEEADVLAAGGEFFLWDGEVPLACEVNDLCAGVVGEWEEGVSEVVGGEGGEEVGLVFGEVGGAFEGGGAGGGVGDFLDVVSGGHPAVDGAAEVAEFEAWVAPDAGVWGEALGVGVVEGGDDFVLEGLSEVDDV